MRHANGQLIRIGDEVIVDGMTGEVVCDCDNREYTDRYSHLDPPSVEVFGDGIPRSGITINTVEAGWIHYEPGSGDIRLVRSCGT